MGWADKAHKKHQMHKMIDQAMRPPQYQEARKKDQQQATLQAMCRLSFLLCEILEYKHGYGHDGLEKALKMLKTRVIEIGEDETYFTDADRYYKDTYNLDVIGVLGLSIDKGEQE